MADATQTLTCRTCHTTWTRKPKRGQRPLRCDECRRQNLERITCEWCDKECISHKGTVHCSYECGAATRSVSFWGNDRSDVPWKPCATCNTRFIASPTHPLRIYCSHDCREQAPAPDRPTKPRLFIEGPCHWCGTRFTCVDQAAALYCSRRCQRQAGRSRRGRFCPSPTLRSKVYERDGYLCQLCGEPVDMDAEWNTDWAPTLDHVEPQSWTLVPDHSESNLQTAHRWCNSVRGARATEEVEVFA